MGIVLQCVIDFKDCFGLDQSQVRLYTAIARHTVLVMAALAICAVTAALLRDRTDTQAPPPTRPDQPPPADPGMVPLTVPEIKHLLAALLIRPNPPSHADRWLDWRRLHQARSHWYPPARPAGPRNREYPGQLANGYCRTRIQIPFTRSMAPTYRSTRPTIVPLPAPGTAGPRTFGEPPPPRPISAHRPGRP